MWSNKVYAIAWQIENEFPKEAGELRTQAAKLDRLQQENDRLRSKLNGVTRPVPNLEDYERLREENATLQNDLDYERAEREKLSASCKKFVQYGLDADEKIAKLQQENAAKDAELKRLRAVVEKLNHTNDGVPITPDMKLLWAAWKPMMSSDSEPYRISQCHQPHTTEEWECGADWIIEGADDDCESLGIYSTREAAAEAARSGEEG